MKIIFFGSSSYVLPIIEVLRKNFNLKLVVTTEIPKPAPQTPQGQALRNCPVIKYCIQNQIPYLSVRQFNNLTIQQLQTINAPIAVLADFGLMIPQEILNVFPMGIINIHPSLLPKYRGPTPVQTAILNGEKTTGVSIIKLDEEVDHGPILKQEKEKILDTDTSETLYKRLFAKGASLLPEVLNFYLKGSLKLIAQNHKNATFTSPLTRRSGFINPNSPINPTALNLMIKAYFPWPGVWFKMKLNDKEKIIKLLPNPLTAQQPNNPILIQVEGKKPMSYKDFLNGYPNAADVISQVFEDGITGKNMP